MNPVIILSFNMWVIVQYIIPLQFYFLSVNSEVVDLSFKHFTFKYVGVMFINIKSFFLFTRFEKYTITTHLSNVYFCLFII